MIRLFKPTANNEESKNNNPAPNRISPGLNRLKKDMEELDVPDNVKVDVPNKDDPGHLIIHMKPTKESLWYQGKYTFSVNVTQEYPYEPPKIYHPNIDYNGKICLNILREDWKPVFNVNTIIIGLNSLFDDPNPSDPLNQEAGEVMRNNRKEFEEIVKKSLKGQSYKGVQFVKFV